MNDNQNQKKWAKYYYRDIRRLLKCPRQTRQRLMGDLQNSIENYLEDYPDATQDQLISHFGSPDEIARDYLASLDQEELQKQISRNSTVRRNLLIILIVVALITGSVYFLLHNWRTNVSYYYDVGITEGTTLESE